MICQLFTKTGTGPSSSVGRVSASGNGRSWVQSPAATFEVVKNGTSCSSLGTQTYGVELGLVDPFQDNVTGCGIMSSVWGLDTSVRQHYKSEH